MRKLTHLSLCSGIGGIDLAAERAGFQTVGQCEIDEYASKVLAKNFKGVPNLHDIRTVTNRRLRELGIPTGNDLTILSAGFPCQPYSLAGKGLGDSDSRDLWGEVARVIGEVRPKWFVGENTPGLFSRENQRYFRRILNDLSSLGYSVGWGIWGACDVGAPHKRNRVFFIAHSVCERRRSVVKTQKNKTATKSFEILLSDEEKTTLQKISLLHGFSWNVPVTNSSLLRNDNGIPEALDRLRCLGNAVVPEQAYPLFEAIADCERGEVCGN